MNNSDREQLETLLEEALAIVRGSAGAEAKSGGTGSGPPPPPPEGP